MNPIERAVRAIDGLQQRRRVPAFLFAVVKKYGDDRGPSLAALIAFYGFLAMFPLLLLFTTVLGFIATIGFRRRPSAPRSASSPSSASRSVGTSRSH